MNIFYTNQDPKKAAADLPPHLANKMLIETFQVLSNPYQNQLAQMPKTAKGTTRKPSYKNHPCSRWATKSAQHVEYLVSYADSLAKRLSEHFGYNISKNSLEFIEYCKNNKPDCSNSAFEAPPECFSGQVPIGGDICSRYRNYLANKPYKKWWKKIDDVPDWIENRESPKWISKAN
jgi:hypothetical protein